MTIFVCLAWSTVAIGLGSTGDFFGANVFIASGEDMLVALIAQIVALLALLALTALSWKGR